MSREPKFQRSDPRMKLTTCEAKIMNSFGDSFSNFSKGTFFLKKNILNDPEMETFAGIGSN
jgi:hypothetical protein